ncbi:Pyrroline-5-carboxylate reductase [Stratiformator vulcanicus]|uniref:Pyrroline-5-carboxylate reductase n=2 Tax=Stratiformator vulcanicus TaxID=2527980 RepID=A0A517QZ45_9PLAN|nr:Pyrroline-5-carboxylate reductase [Stratiformator vulcanicus]
MAAALAKGLVAAEFCKPAQILAGDPIEASRNSFQSATGSTVAESNSEVIAKSDVIVLAVKPQMMAEVTTELKGDIDHAKLVVSIAAGVPIATFTRTLGGDCRIVRVMPNTPCLVGAGAAAYALGGQATDDDAALVEAMFATVGIAEQVSESLLDAVTGLSGSGPAYGFEMIEALSDGGVAAGLPRETATRLAAQTLLGAAKMVLETGEHPGQLKDAVTSPGGTTIAGLRELETGGLRGVLIDTVLAASRRATELGQS